MPCLSTDLDTWMVSGNMGSYYKDYFYPACAVNTVPEILMTGGCNQTNEDSNGRCTTETSTAYTSDGETFADLPPMPVALTSPCVVALDGNDLFVTGGSYYNGFSSDYSEKSYLYHYDTKEWEELPGLLTPREDHMCARVRNSNGDEEVIVAGGFSCVSSEDCIRSLDLVDIYDLQSGQWRSGQSLIIGSIITKCTFTIAHYLQEIFCPKY